MISSGQSYDNLSLFNLLITPDFGFYDNMVADTLGNHPHAMKASMTHNPHTPFLHESISGKHLDDFLTAMGKEIAELEQRDTWIVVNNISLPRGDNLIPSTWAFKIT